MALLASVWTNDVRLDLAAVPTALSEHPTRSALTAITVVNIVVRISFEIMAFSCLCLPGYRKTARAGLVRG